uniref:Reverse transcriptase domain-containing protein n=1 Tax=Tanacetum cinerariifolium TaxID=118510 RepID=A0A6L2J8A5_TANCI|nr:reverse transcriptase domain-containing protein [Tanacetum cinerariifolium]
MERFKIETGRMKGASECMRISGFMHGVNNPELTKRLNEHVPKMMEEIMITTTAFIRGEAAAASKKKGHASWKPQDQSKRHSSDKRPDFRGHPTRERGSNRFTSLTRTPKEILATEAIPSTVHRMLKFPVEGGITTIRNTILIPTECTSVTTSSVIPREERTCSANFTVALHPDFPDQEVVIGGSLFDKGRTELCSVLKKNLDIFTWQPSDITGVPRSVVEHRLNIQEGYSPVRQKKRGQAPERARAIKAEVQKLVDAGIMREVYYHDWLSNPVMVKKHDGSWRMCVDFTDLNKACPQDCYPLPEIDWKVESLCGYPFKCFLNAYKGYHQIQLAEADEEKTAFHTGHGRGPDDRTGNNPNADLLYKPRVTRSGAKLFANGEIGLVTSLCRKRLRRPRTSVKGQILADFLIEMPGDVSQAAPAAVTQEEPWTLFTDGSSCFAASNNEAEYEALVAGLRIATQIGVKNVQVNVDFKLVANQVLGTYVAKEDNMIKYLEIVKGLVNGFTTFSIRQVPRSKNKKADALSKIALTSFAHLSKQVLVEVLENKSIKEKEVAAVIEEDGPTWMTHLVDYLKEGVLLGDKKEARKLCLKARPLQADYVMREIHEGSCSMHARPRSVVAKAVRLGPLSRGAGDGQVSDSLHGLLHKVDRSKGSGNDYRRAGEEIRMGQYCMPLRPREGIKARLREGNKNWVEELPYVLWAHRKMIKSSHGDTPFSLTYGTEAVIPGKIGMPTYRTAVVDVVNNDEELRLNLDLLEERRECAAVCEANAKSKMMKYYNARVCGVAFKSDDFVYRSNDVSHAVAGGKLGPKWEGPYEVTEALGNGAYKL